MCRIMIRNWPMAILWGFGRDLTLGGVLKTHIFPSELDTGWARSLDLAGAGMAGAWTGAAGG